jgi:thiol-disulfide isomerase/thioredoxin
MDLALERQQRDDAILARAEADVAAGAMISVQSLRHLERLLEAAGGQVVVLFMRSSSCGICKELQRELAAVCAAYRRQRAGVVFLETDICDEFDSESELARFYRVRSVPRLLFFVDGAVIRATGMADVRQVSGTRTQLRRSLDYNRRYVTGALQELLLKNTPSARR